MKRKRRIVFGVVLLLLFLIGFSAMWMWTHHKAMVLVKTMQIVVPEETDISAYLPSADTLEQAFCLPQDTTQLSEDKIIVIPETVQSTIEAEKNGNTPKETEQKRKKLKKQVNEWIELFGYLLPPHIAPEDIEEQDVEAVVAIVRPKMSTGDAMKLAAMAEGGLTGEEKQAMYKLLSEKFTEDELTVLVQIYRKYTE